MLKPPAPTMPGMTDTLDFVKNLWGSMNIPGTGMPGMSGMSGLASPTLSTDDLDKRIADLKAVESWLNMNLSMLRGTIQAMEVQRGTLAALKSMGASMAEAMRQSGAGADKMGAMPFMPFFNPTPGAPAPAADSAGTKTAAPAPAAAPAGGNNSAQPGAPAPAGTDSDAAGAAMGMPAAIAWWNLLQDQFQQAVTSAMNSAVPAAPGAQASASAPSTPDAPGAPNAKAAKPAAPAPSPGAQSNDAAGSNGKPRTPRSRADKA
jgi:hypothetical protein